MGKEKLISIFWKKIESVPYAFSCRPIWRIFRSPLGFCSISKNLLFRLFVTVSYSLLHGRQLFIGQKVKVS
jgi:hypothetical protein